MAGHFALENITKLELKTAKGYGFKWSALMHEKGQFIIENETEREAVRQMTEASLVTLGDEVAEILRAIFINKSSEISEDSESIKSRKKELRELNRTLEKKYQEISELKDRRQETYYGWADFTSKTLRKALGSELHTKKKYKRSLLPPHKYLEIPPGWLAADHNIQAITCEGLYNKQKNMLLKILGAHIDLPEPFSTEEKDMLLRILEEYRDLKAFFIEANQTKPLLKHASNTDLFRSPDVLEQMNMSYLYNIGGAQNGNWVKRLKHPPIDLEKLTEAAWNAFNQNDPTMSLIEQMKDGRPVSIEVYNVDDVWMEKWSRWG